MSRGLVLVVGSLVFLGCGDDDDGGEADVSVSLACDLNVEFEQAGQSASTTVCIYASCVGPASTCTTDDANCSSLATQVSAQDGVTATASEVSSCSTKLMAETKGKTDDGKADTVLACYGTEGDAIAEALCEGVGGG